MSETILKRSALVLDASQKAALRRALGRSTSRRRANEVVNSLTGIADFFASDTDWQVFREAIGTDAPEFTQEPAQEYGDFQTPLSLARAVCQKLFGLGYRPEVLIEPTCGKGNFIIAALETFPSIRQVVGLEIQEGYVTECKARLLAALLSRPELKREIQIQQGNIFAEALSPGVLQIDEGEVLILGNPPWVTNTTLSALDSINLPTKSNFKKHAGLDAITGKSNFDIAEFILLQLVREFTKSRATVAMLCKNTVIRNLVAATKDQALPIGNLRAFAFDAAREFGVAADASLFVADITNELGAQTCTLTGLREELAPRVFGWVGKNFVSDAARYRKVRQIEGVSSIVWRQGIKHDCADVMELREENGHWRNGAGELVNVESDLIFPLAKSSDLKEHVVISLRKAVIVPQQGVGEDTTWLKRANPRLWKYLSAHADFFSARRSVIYKGKPPFSIFGVGDYSFKPYKVAISGLYKSSHFSLLLPVDGKPVILDDTCYLLGFDTPGEAAVALGLLNSQPVQDFLKSIVFPDSKRPYTKDGLMRLDLQKVASLVSARSVHDYLSKLEGGHLDFEQKDYEFFSPSGLVGELDAGDREDFTPQIVSLAACSAAGRPAMTGEMKATHLTAQISDAGT